MAKVTALCDVDEKKISQGHFIPYPLKMRIRIIHVTDAVPPLVICVKTVYLFTRRHFLSSTLK